MRTVTVAAARSHTGRVLFAAGFGSVLFVITYLILGAIAPNYSSVRETISALEFTAVGVAQRVNFFVFGLLLCAFASGLQIELGQRRGARLIPLFQFISGLGVIGDALFIHDPAHLVCDLIALNSGLAVLFLFGWRFRNDRRWNGWTVYSIGTAVLMMGLLAAFGVSKHAGGPAGAWEKLATAARAGWSALLTARVLSGVRLD